jgi:hypothetical protein
MKCPNCGNEVYERLDYSIVRCTECYSLWDPFVYPGFPEPDVEIGELWDTSDPEDNFLPDEDNESDDWDEDEEVEEEGEDEWEKEWEEEDIDEWEEDDDEDDGDDWEEEY